MVVLCFSVGFKEGSLEMSDWLEQPEEGGMDSNDQTKGKEAEEEEQGKLLASIEAESSCLETELKGLMSLYALMLFQREEGRTCESGEETKGAEHLFGGVEESKGFVAGS